MSYTFRVFMSLLLYACTGNISPMYTNHQKFHFSSHANGNHVDDIEAQSLQTKKLPLTVNTDTNNNHTPSHVQNSSTVATEDADELDDKCNNQYKSTHTSEFSLLNTTYCNQIIQHNRLIEKHTNQNCHSSENYLYIKHSLTDNGVNVLHQFCRLRK